MDSHAEARAFLQTRRARLSPGNAGLARVGTRRRVPGLRREEVALLAGISVDYYARLEKGHLETASATVLDAIARALQLDAAERAHLHALARATRREEAPWASGRQDAAVRPSVTWMLDSMKLCPAYIRNARLDVLASNAMARALYKPLFDGAGGSPNLATFCFSGDAALRFYPDWIEVAHGMVALLRAEHGRNPSSEALNRLVDNLESRSEDFRNLWVSHDVRQSPAETTRIHHPAVGALVLAVEAQNLAADPGLTMVAYAAEPKSASENGLLRLSNL